MSVAVGALRTDYAILLGAAIVGGAMLASVFFAAWLSPHGRCVRAMADDAPRAGALYWEVQCLREAGGGA
ncbi:hypothetical protein [uncultured Jannaschia sp.]|uniref:hypothetical protein n=1 Tax=uncultured Jannaschia sp. TaxID=293347 RepID=UPI00260CFCC0|nr:hypothetical protein [uncultured Jannaschia sp.]